MRIFTVLVCAVCMTLAALLPVRSVQAMNRDVKAVLVASEYGLLGGTVLGLATLPFSQNLRTVFLGSSLGLYLGAAVGFYYIFNRDEPGNPLRPRQPQYDESRRREPDPAEREGELKTAALSRAKSGLECGLAQAQSEPLRLTVAVYRF